MDGFQRGYELENEVCRAVSWLDVKLGILRPFFVSQRGGTRCFFLIHFYFVPASQCTKEIPCMICRFFQKFASCHSFREDLGPALLAAIE